jgi:major membrane immunogen (membrane-anchored lipoprotein)
MKKSLLILAALVFAVTACDKNTYVDGNYSATFDEADSRGWNTVVEFTLTDDVVSNVDFDDFDQDGNRKSEDEAYQDRMYNGAFVLVDGDTVRTNPETFTPVIESALSNATIVPEFEPIDAVAGATSSSGNANALMEAALNAAVDGDPTDVAIPRPSK